MFKYKVRSLIALLILIVSQSAHAQWGDFFTTNLQEEEFSEQDQVRDGEEISFLNDYEFRPYAGLSYVLESPVGVMGLKVNIPIIKSEMFLGVRLPFIFTFDNFPSNSILNKHKYNEIVDYFDIIDYFQYNTRKKRWFVRLSNIENTTLGNGNIMKNYDMRIHSLSYDQLGVEVQYKHQDNRVYLMLSDIKKFLDPVPSTLIGLHAEASPLSKFKFSFTAVADLNEYSSLRDYDEDNVPDIFDLYSEDKTFATNFDHWANQPATPAWPKISGYKEKGWYPQSHIIEKPDGTLIRQYDFQDNLLESRVVQDRIRNGYIDTTYNLNTFYPFLSNNFPKDVSQVDSSNYVDLQSARQMSIVLGVEGEYTFIENSAEVVSAYSHVSSIIEKNSFGIGIGGNYKLKNNFGNFIDVKAEARYSTKEFLFSYFNHTHETQKAVLSRRIPFMGAENTRKNGINYLFTKMDLLERVNQSMVGGHFDFNINFFNYSSLRLYGGMMIGIGEDPFESANAADGDGLETQDVATGAVNDGLTVTTYGIEIELGKLISPIIHSGRIFLTQNNYISRSGEQFTSSGSFMPFARPETVFGLEMILKKTNSGSLRFNWETPFVDKNGNGTIDGWNESIKNISLTGVIIL